LSARKVDFSVCFLGHSGNNISEHLVIPKLYANLKQTTDVLKHSWQKPGLLTIIMSASL